MNGHKRTQSGCRGYRVCGSSGGGTGAAGTVNKMGSDRKGGREGTAGGDATIHQAILRQNEEDHDVTVSTVAGAVLRVLSHIARAVEN